VTRYIEGFSHFVTSMTAPTTSGWSICRVGFAPTGKRRLFTAHTPKRPLEAGDPASASRHFSPDLCPQCLQRGIDMRFAVEYVR